MKVGILGALFTVLVLAGCGSSGKGVSLNPFSSSKVKPAELVNFKEELRVRMRWSVDVGQAQEGQFVAVANDTTVYAASAEGTLWAIGKSKGNIEWKIKTETKLRAGVALAADTLAVVDVNNQLLAYDLQGKQKWKVNLGAEVISPPVGAGRHLVVRSLDHTVLNYATDNGALRWRFARPLPPLTLRIASGVDVVANRVFAGFPGGRVVGLDLVSGVLVWEGTLANPTGTTEVERIADITGQPHFNLREVCAAAFQGHVGCLDGTTGRLVWSQPFSAPLGASVDERYVVAQNELGDVFAFSRASGQEVWRVPYFQRRGAQTPVAMGRAVVITDQEGYIHFVDRDTGRTLARTRLGSAGMAAQPVVLDGGELLVQSRKGDLALLVVQ